ncbi:hypothetical protein [Roseibacillus persicicus]|uniref:hypothetical protein n=1 Tax=Roseibacillus persicicus TaxID=454148 RepID=UPI00280DB611|nr:hypothetical protein [Roseibacillus persicicus]MDQ8191170.1 hypothetical protein [Roseibacillus persicicus]
MRTLQKKRVRVLTADLTPGLRHPSVEPIREEMVRLQRSTVPVLALYRPDDRQNPLVFPEICTPETFLKALEDL